MGVMAGAASGLASAFNTPLEGIVYVAEELAKSHLSTFRTGVLHSVIFAGIISQMIMGPYLYLGFPKVSTFKSSLIAHYFFVAAISSLVIIVFSYLLKVIVMKRELIIKVRTQFFITLLLSFAF